MARILVGTWAIRYPLGGNLSWTLQWLHGFQKLGHEVFLLEKSGYPISCFDPARDTMGDDPTYGIGVVRDLLSRFGLEASWCYVDAGNRHHGLTARQVDDLFATADLLVDLGTHGAWLPEAAGRVRSVVVDGEPGATQMKRHLRQRAGEWVPEFDHYYTNGANLGTDAYRGPGAGVAWRHVFNPVVLDLLEYVPAAEGAPFTTVMNWKAHEPLLFEGRVYGQKDQEFDRFVSLAARCSAPLEVAAAGVIPHKQLGEAGWRLRSAHEVTSSYDRYLAYLRASAGEFSVCKHVYVETWSGWFSDRSAAYLAAGRPVVLQDTGFSAHLPVGEGLFAVRTVEEAAAALEEIRTRPRQHERRAREIAREHLDAPVVLGRLLRELGL